MHMKHVTFLTLIHETDRNVIFLGRAKLYKDECAAKISALVPKPPHIESKEVFEETEKWYF